ncbi:uncharacterized protein YjiS (DUF1127 family) [Pseudomonas alcaligenes]|nr:uncharacterized protein YjiS (DUF1127 family) [Pseudomonas alcaligenes]
MERSFVSPAPADSPQQRTPLAIRLFARIAEWQRNLRTRHQLAQLNAQQLADIGLSECDRSQELDKPFWR